MTPSGRNVVHYERRSPRAPHCAICSTELNGISINRNSKGRSLRTNSRKFGGVLCARCASDVIKLASRMRQEIELPLDCFPYALVGIHAEVVDAYEG